MKHVILSCLMKTINYDFYVTREHLQQFVLPGIPYTNKYNTKINVNTNYEYSKTIELNKMIE